ncbi:16S rRNA (uracil(1498)-N(3))-methyltransferase [Demequina oxidasica]|uniref:16S rRNA (uracil(1498)-N(3))-methyltransferase n=1 Tax=Demequina oxidasica TaxID=676199 RepID=UPI00078474D7|nr:16S rRNA (uracil(1498)-N(3))-methyltransferase [Demequina oxidasica]
MSAPVFICPAAADAVVGSVIEVSGEEARHAVTVQRRLVGEAVDLVDGTGARASGRIVEIGDSRMTVEVAEVSRDADPEIVLVQALAKGGRDEQAIEAATELGVTRVVPWAAERSIVQWRGTKVSKARARWLSLVTAATKQSRRALIPTVETLASTKQLAQLVSTATGEGARVLVLHEVAATPIVDLDWEGGTDVPVWMIVGPEGGVSDHELDVLGQAGAEAVLLGPHVLRASSAGPAAIAALAAIRGTWSTRVDGRGFTLEG